MLEDGTYDALVIDATDVDGAVRAELTITSGPHKGEVVVVRGTFPGKASLDLLAAPATLVVAGGQPTVTLD